MAQEPIQLDYRSVPRVRKSSGRGRWWLEYLLSIVILGMLVPLVAGAVGWAVVMFLKN